MSELVTIPPMTLEQMLQLQPETVFSIYEILTLFVNMQEAETVVVEWNAGAKQFYDDVVEATQTKLREASFDRILEFTNYQDTILGNASNSISQLARQELLARTFSFCRQG